VNHATCSGYAPVNMKTAAGGGVCAGGGVRGGGIRGTGRLAGRMRAWVMSHPPRNKIRITTQKSPGFEKTANDRWSESRDKQMVGTP